MLPHHATTPPRHHATTPPRTRDRENDKVLEAKLRVQYQGHGHVNKIVDMALRKAATDRKEGKASGFLAGGSKMQVISPPINLTSEYHKLRVVRRHRQRQRR